MLKTKIENELKGPIIMKTYNQQQSEKLKVLAGALRVMNCL